MKKVFVAISLFIAVALCCSCGPSLKSMKDADAFLKQERQKAAAEILKDGKQRQKINYKPSIYEPNAGLGGAVASGVLFGATAGLLSGGASLATRSPRPGKKITSGVELSTHMFFYGKHTMYRKDKDGDEWNISIEAVRRAGPAPQVNTCKFIVAGVRNVLPVRYQGDDGHIVMADSGVSVVKVMGSRKEEPPCMTEDLAAYKEYLEKITNATFDIIDEEDARLDKALREEQGAAQ